MTHPLRTLTEEQELEAKINPLVKEVYICALDEVKKAYGQRLQASYLLGSLVHGGFSPGISDIDVSFILKGDEITPADWDTFDTIRQTVRETTKYGNKLSLFWSSLNILTTRVASGAVPTWTRENGVFPPYDVLDLIQNGLFLDGEDVRDRLKRPTVDDLYVNNVEFLLSILPTEEKQRSIMDKSYYSQLDDRDTSKLILLPSRLQYTLFTGKVGNNEDAALHYMDNLPKEAREAITALVDHSLRLRDGKPRDTTLLTEHFPAIRKMYQRLIELHIRKMDELGRQDYADRLKEWHDNCIPRLLN
ncbi:hypothetical protein J7E85_32725 [Paenibacillus sp. ISL-20]|nr:hypothetical protein [Paenibacillus sp. ISL-20]